MPGGSTGIVYGTIPPFSIAFYYGDSTSTSGLTLLGYYKSKGLTSRQGTLRDVFRFVLPKNVLYGTRYIHYFIDYDNKVKELKENNNRGYAALRLFRRPNLQVSEAKIASSSQVAGNAVKLTYRIYNAERTRVSGNFSVGFYYSEDGTITTSDTRLGTKTFNGVQALSYLNGTSSIVVSLRLPATAKPGTRYLGVFVDYANQVSEYKEKDNIRTIKMSVSSPYPDLSMHAWSTSASSLRGAGSALTVTFDVKNAAAVKAGSFKVSFYYGDATSTSGLTLLGSRTITGLSPGAKTGNQTIAITLPTNVLHGARFVHYAIDSANQVREYTESNNRGYRGLQITGLPNLQVSNLTLSPKSPKPGDRVTVSYTYYNAGYSRTPGAFSSRLYLCLGREITSTDKVAKSDIARLNARTRISLSYFFFAYATSGLKTGYVGAFADYRNSVKNESSETDNQKFVAITGGLPDLRLKRIKLTRTSVAGNGAVTDAWVDVQNVGTANGGGYSVALYYGNSTSTSGLRYLGRANFRRTMVGYTSGTQIVRLRLHNGALYGTRYIHYFIDYTNQNQESNENNNRGYTTIRITGRPDLSITSLRVTPSTQSAGGKISVSYKVSNGGFTAANKSTLRLYLSRDKTITTSDTLLSSVSIPALYAGTSSSGAAGSTATPLLLPKGLASGTYYIGAYADATRAVTESRETNNTFAIPIRVGTVVVYPDLKMQTWRTSATSVRGAGSTVRVSFQISNAGNGSAGKFAVHFYYGDSTSPTGLTSLGMYTVSGLTLGKSTSLLTANLTLPKNVLYGTRYIHYAIDSSNVIKESSESNNRGVRTLGITGKPNLQIRTFRLTTSAPSAGGTANLVYRLYNAGYSRTERSFDTRFYHSTNSLISIYDTYLNKEIKNASLLALSSYPASGDGTVSITIPSNAKSGSYLGVIVDYNQRVSETSGADNTQKVMLQLKTLPSTPDLVLKSLKFTTGTIAAGTSFKVDYEVTNQGRSSVGTYRVNFYLSATRTISSSDRLLLSFTLSGLTAGQSKKGVRTVRLPTGVKGGSVYLNGFIDADRKIAESNENNNVYSAPIKILSDQDGDGVKNDKDCDDTDKTIYPGAKEICDGKDNNCDGKVDENLSRSCYTGPANTDNKGLCKKGQQICQKGKWGSCQNQVTPAKEICDGQDNNCDGKVDENLSRSCYTGPVGTDSKGLCKSGQVSCLNGKWGSCRNQVTPTKEICDGKDNDCDGRVDNQSNSRDALTQKCQNSCGKEEKQRCEKGKWGVCSTNSCPKPEQTNPEKTTPDEAGHAEKKDEAAQPEQDGGMNEIPEADEKPETDEKPEADEKPKADEKPDAPSDDCRLTGCPNGQRCEKGQCVPITSEVDGGDEAIGDIDTDESVIPESNASDSKSTTEPKTDTSSDAGPHDLSTSEPTPRADEGSVDEPKEPIGGCCSVGSQPEQMPFYFLCLIVCIMCLPLSRKANRR